MGPPRPNVKGDPRAHQAFAPSNKHAVSSRNQQTQGEAHRDALMTQTLRLSRDAVPSSVTASCTSTIVYFEA